MQFLEKAGGWLFLLLILAMVLRNSQGFNSIISTASGFVTSESSLLLGSSAGGGNNTRPIFSLGGYSIV